MFNWTLQWIVETEHHASMWISSYGNGNQREYEWKGKHEYMGRDLKKLRHNDNMLNIMERVRVIPMNETLFKSRTYVLFIKFQ